MKDNFDLPTFLAVSSYSVVKAIDQKRGQTLLSHRLLGFVNRVRKAKEFYCVAFIVKDCKACPGVSISRLTCAARVDNVSHAFVKPFPGVWRRLNNLGVPGMLLLKNDWNMRMSDETYLKFELFETDFRGFGRKEVFPDGINGASVHKQDIRARLFHWRQALEVVLFVG